MKIFLFPLKFRRSYLRVVFCNDKFVHITGPGKANNVFRSATVSLCNEKVETFLKDKDIGQRTFSNMLFDNTHFLDRYK